VRDLLGGGLADLGEHGLEPLLLDVELLAAGYPLELDRAQLQVRRRLVVPNHS